MLRWFDYLFYRVARFYEVRRRMPEPERFGFYAVFIVLISSLADLTLLISLFMSPWFWDNLKLIGILMTVVVFPLCFLRYYSEKRLKRVKALWNNEDTRLKKRRRVYLTTWAVVVILLPFVFAFLKHDLHWI